MSRLGGKPGRCCCSPVRDLVLATSARPILNQGRTFPRWVLLPLPDLQLRNQHGGGTERKSSIL
jgi:hypothetical protein